jgi:hypothetical protein
MIHNWQESVLQATKQAKLNGPQVFYTSAGQFFFLLLTPGYLVFFLQFFLETIKEINVLKF